MARARNRYMDEIQRADRRAENHYAALKRGAKQDFVAASEWVTSINILRWSDKAVLMRTPQGEKWIPLSALRGRRVVNGADMAIPFGYAADPEPKEIAAWYMAELESSTL